MAVNSTLLRRLPALAIVTFVAMGPLALFVGSAQAAYKSTPYQTSRMNAGTPNSDVVKTNAGDGAL
jgi:hypothetical protein